MKTTVALSPPAKSYSRSVKKYLKTGVYCLGSEKISIFATVIAALLCWVGVLAANEYITGCGGVLFTVGFTPWAIREAARNNRRNRLGLINDK